MVLLLRTRWSDSRTVPALTGIVPLVTGMLQSQSCETQRHSWPTSEPPVPLLSIGRTDGKRRCSMRFALAELVQPGNVSLSWRATLRCRLIDLAEQLFGFFVSEFLKHDPTTVVLKFDRIHKCSHQANAASSGSIRVKFSGFK